MIEFMMRGTPNFTTRTALINYLIRVGHYTRYLEIGAGDGRHFREVQCAHKDAIDPAVSTMGGVPVTHQMTSDEYFSRYHDQYVTSSSSMGCTMPTRFSATSGIPSFG